MKYEIFGEIWYLVCLKVTLEDGAIGERRLVMHDLKVVETESYHSLHLFCMFVISFNKMLLERAEINNKHNRINQIKSWFFDKINEIESGR